MARFAVPSPRKGRGAGAAPPPKMYTMTRPTMVGALWSSRRSYLSPTWHAQPIADARRPLLLRYRGPAPDACQRRPRRASSLRRGYGNSRWCPHTTFRVCFGLSAGGPRVCTEVVGMYVVLLWAVAVWLVLGLVALLRARPEDVPRVVEALARWWRR